MASAAVIAITKRSISGSEKSVPAACLDRLAMMGADRELKMIAGRLSRLTFRAAPLKESPGRAGALGSIEEHI